MTVSKLLTVKTLALASALALSPVLGGSAPAQAGVFVGVSVGIAPPALPVYLQPAIPGAGYIWTPGYWAWGGEGYYWVPGAWVLPPQPGFLWTPAWWGFEGGYYHWHAGYWGPTVGFYGGINYGFGYGGVGYDGGYWNHGHFFYNSAVNNFGSTHIHNTYVHNTVVNNSTHESFYHGGPGHVTNTTATAPGHRPVATDPAAHVHGGPVAPEHVTPAHAPEHAGPQHYGAQHLAPVVSREPHAPAHGTMNEPARFGHPGGTHSPVQPAHFAPAREAAHPAPHAQAPRGAEGHGGEHHGR